MFLGSPCLNEVTNMKTAHLSSKLELLQCKGYEAPKENTTVLTILFLLELPFFFDYTIKRVFYADTVNIGMLVELQPGVNI